MTDPIDCAEARTAIQRAVTGAPVTDVDLERALAHVAACVDCSAQFDLRHPLAFDHAEDREILAELIREPEMLAETEGRVDPVELFERSLAGALTDPDRMVRLRAAERLGRTDRLGAPALLALADAAAEDRDTEVRSAALSALDELDASVSIPQRLIAAWSASPEEAAPFIEGVLARLAADEPPATEAVTELTGSTWSRERQIEFTGKGDIRGRMSLHEDELRLALEGLPSIFEKTRPTIAFPAALTGVGPPVDWPGEQPGLVPAEARVAEGRLEVRLGRMKEPPAEPGESSALARAYLLSPESARKSQ
jgi:hypothetical protein